MIPSRGRRGPPSHSAITQRPRPPRCRAGGAGRVPGTVEGGSGVNRGAAPSPLPSPAPAPVPGLAPSPQPAPGRTPPRPAGPRAANTKGHPGRLIVGPGAGLAGNRITPPGAGMRRCRNDPTAARRRPRHVGVTPDHRSHRGPHSQGDSPAGTCPGTHGVGGLQGPQCPRARSDTVTGVPIPEWAPSLLHTARGAPSPEAPPKSFHPPSLPQGLRHPPHTPAWGAVAPPAPRQPTGQGTLCEG